MAGVAACSGPRPPGSGWRRQSVREPASFNRPAAGHRRRRRPGPYQDAVVRRVRGPGPRVEGRKSHRRLSGRPVQEDRPQAGQYRRHLPSEGPAGRHHPGAGAAGVQERLPAVAPAVEGRCRGLDQARGGPREPRQLGAGVRRLRRRRAGIQLGRLQRRRREGQDARHARQRPAGARSGEPVSARSQDLWRQGDDVLRPLDLQVRNRRASGAPPASCSSTRPNRPAIPSTSCNRRSASSSIS